MMTDEETNGCNFIQLKLFENATKVNNITHYE